MARNFRTVAEQIKAVAPQLLREKLEQRTMGYWAPEVAWVTLSEYVNRYVRPSSTDKTAIAVYAILCDCTEEEMKRRFIADGV